MRKPFRVVAQWQCSGLQNRLWGLDSLLPCHFFSEDEMKKFFERVVGYFSEVKGEARRVTWPGKHELYDSTLVVIAFIIILAVTTLTCDWVIGKFISLVHAGV